MADRAPEVNRLVSSRVEGRGSDDRQRFALSDIRSARQPDTRARVGIKECNCRRSAYRKCGRAANAS